MNILFEMYPTIITPFTDENRIDYDCLGSLIGLYARCGVDGIFAVCQSSEMFFLTDDEKLELAAFCIEKCKEYHIRCVVSGHTQEELADQIAYLRRLEQLGPDAIILVNNRFAKEKEPEEICIANFHRIIKALRPDTILGVYECPYPYKRLISDALLDEMVSDGRFRFIKDTCCVSAVIKKRIDRVHNSPVKLYNANAATLYQSITEGAAGYSGVMLNIVPELFSILREAFRKNDLVRAHCAADAISAASVIECQNYPANAKYAQMRRGVFKNTAVRNGKPPLTESQRKEMDSFLIQTDRMMYGLLPHTDVMKIFRGGSAFDSCHASSVLPLDSRKLLVVYFAGSREGGDDVGIWLSVYASGAWKKPVCIAKVCASAHWNPVIYEIPGGVRVNFKVGKSVPEWTGWHTESYDEGESWTEPIPYGNAVGPVRSKPIRLENGAMLAPNSVETTDSWQPGIDISYDNGETYERLADIPLNRTDKGSNTYIEGLGAIQPTLWESAPGKIHALLRTTCGYIFRSDSFDNGRTWCTAYSTGLPNNNSGIDVVYADGCLYLVMNPVSGNWAPRTPLVILRSADNGKTFTAWKTLADTLMNDGDIDRADMAEFSYPAIVHRDGTLYITFTYNRKEIAFAAIRI